MIIDEKVYSQLKNNNEKIIFDNIMSFASKLESANPNALVDLIRVLLKPLQTKLLLLSIESQKHHPMEILNHYKFFMPNGPINIQSQSTGIELDKNDFLINLNKDPILPCPWNPDRYVQALSQIGLTKSRGEFKQDPINHHVSIWLPWGIAFVNNGNHSIATGILGGEGVIIPTYVSDMRHMINEIKCDGINYISIDDTQILDSVNDVRIGAVFEIGRMLQKHKIMPMQK